ncbi:hypothetical protein KVR01_013649 [Diaporthe batatas]|uniref:uncharacterized protein n=1 Tax=Diaporthe batatas TaxID=748121 RepID=UPI001D0510FD|nr:uncharacterized protein KVR01_013649 [Diaporthe batatas]KAG8156545.1 hypothetical protein KVR01_013649 [Diaporthe batatas]
MAGILECIRADESAGDWAEELHRALWAQEESINARVYIRPLIHLNKCYIEELPDKLLANIFNEVVTDSSRDILSSVRTNRRFHDLAIPLLYRCLELLPGRSREDMQSLGLSFRRHPERRGYAREAKLHGGSDKPRSLGQFPVLFSRDAFPNIKRLHGIRVAVTDLQNLAAVGGASTGTSTIEELVFEDSDISPAGLDALMSACKVVRKLVLHWGQGNAESPRDGEYLNEAMGAAIARHAATIDTLEFNPDGTQIGTAPENQPRSLKDQLASFMVLKDLTIHLACFSGGDISSSTVNTELMAERRFYDFLPTCLERLALIGEPDQPTNGQSAETRRKNASLRTEFTMFFNECGPAGRFSRMREVQFPGWVDDPNQGCDGDVLPELKVLASQANVSIAFKGKALSCEH